MKDTIKTGTCKQRGYRCCYPDKQTGICPTCGTQFPLPIRYGGTPADIQINAAFNPPRSTR